MYVDLEAERSFRSPEAALPERRTGVVRLVLLSDTHLWHRQLWVPAGDVLLHAGDSLSEWGHGMTELADFAEWLGRLPHAEKVVVGGNHDRCLEELGAMQTAQVFAHYSRDSQNPAGVAYLHPDHKATTSLRSGLVVAGLPWSVPSNAQSKNKAFQPPPDDSSFSDVPDCDILLTHGPPFSALDSNRGSTWLLAAVERVRPRLHAFGHVHEARGAMFRSGGAFVNAAMCNDFFCAVRRPIVVDMPVVKS